MFGESERHLKFRKIPIAIEGPIIPKVIINPLLEVGYKFLGATDADVQELIPHERKHTSVHPKKFHVIGALRDKRGNLVGAYNDFLGRYSALEAFEKAVAVGLVNMSDTDVEAVGWSISHANAQELDISR